MHPSTFLVSLAITCTVFTSTTTSLALPDLLSWARKSEPNYSIHKRGLPGAVYICTQENFQGPCGWVPPSSDCHIPGTGGEAPKSIGPDPGGYCTLYSTNTCTGNTILSLDFPGVASNLPQFASLKCAANAPSGTVSGVVDGVVAPEKGVDPRLAGGEGSMEAEKLEERIGKVDKSEGMIGLDKKIYY